MTYHTRILRNSGLPCGHNCNTPVLNYTPYQQSQPPGCPALKYQPPGMVFQVSNL